MDTITLDYQQNLSNGMDKKTARYIFDVNYLKCYDKLFTIMDETIKQIDRVKVHIKKMQFLRNTIDPVKYPLFNIRFKKISSRVNKANHHVDYLIRYFTFLTDKRSNYDSLYAVL